MIREIRAKLAAAVGGRRRLASELDEEIAAHLEMQTRDFESSGMSRGEAEQQARRGFGNPVLTAERSRDTWSFRTLETILLDIRYGLRRLARAPAASLVIILTLALGIGATTAIFSVVDAILLAPLPYPHGERLVWLGEGTKQASGISVTWLNLRHWQEENHSFERIAGFQRQHFTLTNRGDARLIRAGVISADFFPLVGARAAQGRLFGKSDEQRGATPAVVLTREFWIGQLSSDPNIVGSFLTLDGKAYRIAGVLATGPRFFYSPPVDVFVPLSPDEQMALDRSHHGSIHGLGLLRPGVSLEAAKADLDSIMQRLAQSNPGAENEHRAAAEMLSESRKAGLRPVLWALMGAVVLVLLIACANVAGLVLAQSVARTREIAIRSAIGAGRSRLARQLLTENLLVSVLGGGAGLLLAFACLRALIAIAPPNLSNITGFVLNGNVLAFAVGLTVFTGLAVGCAPMLAARRCDVNAVLKESSRWASGARTGQRYRNLLVTGEIALTMVLAFAAGLLVRSLIAAETRDPGFDPDHILALELVLPEAKYGKSDAQAAFFDQVVRAMRTLPGVSEASGVMCPPGAGDCNDWFYSIVGRRSPSQSDIPVALINTATPDYFRTLRIPLLEGRAFEDTDRAGGPRVAIVNEVFAKEWWRASSAVGGQIKLGGPYRPGPVVTIIGVSGNFSQDGLDGTPLPEIFFPFAQSPSSAMVVMIRGLGEQSVTAAMARRALANIDAQIPVQRLRPLSTALGEGLTRRRFGTALLALFALLALTLTTVGIYGMLAYWVRSREEDLAIRIALGASPGAIVRLAGGQLLRFAGTGILVGAAGAWASMRFLQSFVFGVPAQSPGTLWGAAAGVLLFALIAAAGPMRRAARTDAAFRLREG